MWVPTLLDRPARAGDAMRAGSWYQCGFLPDGRAGSDAGDARLVPCPAPAASARDVFDGGWGFAVARVDADDATGGRLYAWGECARDHVLEEPPTTSSRARLPARLDDAAADAREDPGPVAAGWAHVVFLVDGAGGTTARILGWDPHARAPSPEIPTPTPRDIHLPRRVRALAAGERHTLAVCEDGSAWAWGDDACGQLGTTRRDEPESERPSSEPAADPPTAAAATTTTTISSSSASPSRVALPPGVTAVLACAGARHSVLIDARGAAYAFGWGLHGQLGLGDCEDARAPTRVASLDGIFIARAAAGAAHTVLLTRHGAAYAFGSNHHGQLGVPEETCPLGGASAEPVMIEIRAPDEEARGHRRASPPDVFDVVSCGSRHTAAVSRDGTVRAWGWNARGQLGTGDRIHRATPTRVDIPGGGRAARVACGWWHTLVEVVDEEEG